MKMFHIIILVLSVNLAIGLVTSLYDENGNALFKGACSEHSHYGEEIKDKVKTMQYNKATLEGGDENIYTYGSNVQGISILAVVKNTIFFGPEVLGKCFRISPFLYIPINTLVYLAYIFAVVFLISGRSIEK